MKRKRLSPSFEIKYPKLLGAGYEVTSVKDKIYNCMAWAAKEDKKNWWEPTKGAGLFWPDGLPMHDYSVQNYAMAMRRQGFTIESKDGSLEPGLEKVVIFGDAKGEFTHAAKQLPNGRWSSKLGEEEDICHYTVDAVESQSYGTPHIYLGRKVSLLKKLLRFILSPFS